MSIEVKMKVREWNYRLGEFVYRKRTIIFKQVNTMEELHLWLKKRVSLSLANKEIESVGRELDSDGVGLGVGLAGLREVYASDVAGRIRAFGGGEATGTRKTLRETRGKVRHENDGEWNMNL